MNPPFQTHHDAFANINRVSAGACYRFVRANDYALIGNDAVEMNALADVSALHDDRITHHSALANLNATE